MTSETNIAPRWMGRTRSTTPYYLGKTLRKIDAAVPKKTATRPRLAEKAWVETILLFSLHSTSSFSFLTHIIMDRIKELGLRSITEDDLARIMRSVSSGSPSSPGTGVSMSDSGDSGTSSLSGDGLGGLGNTSTGTGTEDNLSLPSELLAELGGSPLPWRGDGRAGAVGGGGAAVGRVPYPSYPPDLCTE